MRRNPKHFAGLAAAVLTIGSLLAVGIWLGPGATGRNHPAAEADQPANVAFSSGPDLDGDHKPDSVQIDENGLTVAAANGTRLLTFKTTVLPGYHVLHLNGSDNPALLVATAPAEYAAFSYDPGTGLMQLVTWPGGQARGYGELTADGGLAQTVVGTSTRRRIAHYSLDQAHLAAAGVSYTPLTESRKTPSAALAAAIEAVMLGLPQELPVHFPDADVARQFYARWQGKLPAGGAVLVAQADQVDAGAEHGRLVPVTVWVAGKQDVAGLKGQAEFVSGPTGVQILRISLEPIPLKVASWDAAARLAAARRPGAGPWAPADAPFYGRFRFVAGQARLAVDAVTGTVEDE